MLRFVIPFVLVALAACSPLPEQSRAPTPGHSTATTSAPSVAPASPSPDACADGSITVIDGRSTASDAILADLGPTKSLGTLAVQLRERWNDSAGSAVQLGSFETILLTGSNDRELQAEIGVSPGNERPITMLAPIDDSDHVRAVAVRQNLPLAGEHAADPTKLVQVLAFLVGTTAAPGRPSALSSCVLERFGSLDTDAEFVGLDRQVLIPGESIAYRVLELESVIWLTATKSDSVAQSGSPEPSVSPPAGSTALSIAEFALMRASGSNCESSHEGEMDVAGIDFEGMANGIGPEGGVLKDGRGWVGSIEDAGQHFGASAFVAEDKGEHWFITRDPATLQLLLEANAPTVAALIPIPLSGGRTAWYLGPRWFSACLRR